MRERPVGDVVEAGAILAEAEAGATGRGRGGANKVEIGHAIDAERHEGFLRERVGEGNSGIRPMTEHRRQLVSHAVEVQVEIKPALREGPVGRLYDFLMVESLGDTLVSIAAEFAIPLDIIAAGIRRITARGLVGPDQKLRLRPQLVGVDVIDPFVALAGQASGESPEKRASLRGDARLHVLVDQRQ